MCVPWSSSGYIFSAPATYKEQMPNTTILLTNIDATFKQIAMYLNRF